MEKPLTIHGTNTVTLGKPCTPDDEVPMTRTGCLAIAICMTIGAVCTIYAVAPLVRLAAGWISRWLAG